MSRQCAGGLVGEIQAAAFRTCQTGGAELLSGTEKPSEAPSPLK